MCRKAVKIITYYNTQSNVNNMRDRNTKDRFKHSNFPGICLNNGVTGKCRIRIRMKQKEMEILAERNERWKRGRANQPVGGRTLYSPLTPEKNSLILNKQKTAIK